MGKRGPKKIERDLAWRTANRERAKAHNRKHDLMVKYGLTIEEFTALAANGCMICGSLENLHVDHDHKTNRVRGVLCGPHNVGLGMFHDSPDEMRKAIQYLDAHRG